MNRAQEVLKLVNQETFEFLSPKPIGDFGNDRYSLVHRETIGGMPYTFTADYSTSNKDIDVAFYVTGPKVSGTLVSRFTVDDPRLAIQIFSKAAGIALKAVNQFPAKSITFVGDSTEGRDRLYYKMAKAFAKRIGGTVETSKLRSSSIEYKIHLPN